MKNYKNVDLYTVGVGLQYYEDNEHYLKAGDSIIITSNNRIIKDDIILGNVAKQTRYYEKGYEILDTLLENGTYSLNNEDSQFVDSDDLDFLYREDTDGSVDDILAGQVIFADGEISIIYLGEKSEEEIYSFEDEYEEIDMEEDISLDSLLDLGPWLSCPCEELVISDKYTDYGMNNDILLRKEEDKMENVFGKLGFGKCADPRFSLSMNGIAVRAFGSDKYVVYNKDNNEFVDATDMLISVGDGLFILPAVEVNVGDTVIHEGKPYYITSVANNEIKAVSYEECTQTVLIPKTTMFGLKYFKKVFSMFGDNFASTGEMFKNPMMLMALMNGDKDSDLSNLLLMSSMGNGDFASNPMLMALLMKKGNKTDMSDLLMLSMLNGNNNPFTGKTKKAEDNKNNK